MSSTAQQQAQKNPVVVFKTNLSKMLQAGDVALPSNVSADAFYNAAVIAFTDNPKIAECTPESVFRSIRRLASMGLVPDGREAALAPFWDSKKGQTICQDMPMVQGVIKRIRNSDQVRSLHADVVYEGERVNVWYDDEGVRRFEHVDENGQKLNAMTRGGNVIGAIAVASVDGEVDFEPITKERIEKSRNQSRQPNKGPWKDHYEEMAKKTVLHAFAKRLPVSSEDRRLLRKDQDHMVDISPRATGTPLEAPEDEPSLTLIAAAESSLDEPINSQTEPDAKEANAQAEQKSTKPKQTTTPKAEGKSKAASKKAEPAAEVEDADLIEDTPTESDGAAQDAAPAEDLPDQVVSLRDQIVEALEDANDTGDIEGIMGMFEQQIDYLRDDFPSAYDAVTEAENEARERVA